MPRPRRSTMGWIVYLLTDTSEPKDPSLKAVAIAAILGMLVGALLT